jgi:SAM-dependent methyltransferase
VANLDKYQSRNPVQRYLIRRFLDRVAELSARVAPTTVLDAGCGEGFVHGHLAARLGGGVAFTGLDVTAAALRESRSRGSGAPLLQGSVTALPLAGASFDLVVCTEVLEHLDRPAQALDELCRVSRRFLLLSVPREPFFAGCNLLRGRHLCRLGSEVDHCQHWTRWGFLRFARQRLRILAAPQDAFPWTLVLGELRSRR